jgi:predicted PurR-regulated permease PerM
MVASPIIVEGHLWGLVAAIVACVLASLVAVIVRNLSRSKLGCRPASLRRRGERSFPPRHRSQCRHVGGHGPCGGP